MTIKPFEKPPKCFEETPYIKNNWGLVDRTFDKHEIKIEISGLDAIPSFTFKKKHLKYKTFLTYIFLQSY